MGGLLAGGSILAAFFGGAVALFSPCCIVFLLPAYMAAGVKNRRWRLLPLSLVFALGLGVVLIPITLGMGLVARTLAKFHTPLYIGGGLLLLALALLALTGRSWSMPSFMRAPSLQRSDTAGMFALGVFSGIASSCCAPVLAGVMTLSALSSSLGGSFLLGAAYVFGMMFPLFLFALGWDRFHLGERRLFKAKPVTLRVFGRKIATNTVNIAVAVAFAAMGGLVLFLAAEGNPMGAGGPQLAIGRWLSSFFERVLSWLEPVPELVLGLGLLALAGLFVFAAVHRRPVAQPIQGGSDHEQEAHQGLARPSTQHAHDEEAPACH